MLEHLRRPARISRKRTEVSVAYACNLLRRPNPDQMRVVLFAQGRTGTTLLENLIGSTGEFREHGELLSTDYGEVRFPVPYISGMSKWHSRHNSIFHVKIYHLTDDRRRPVDPGSFLRSMDDAGFKFLYLRRRNPVRHALSNLIALQRGTYHKFDDDREAVTLSVDCSRLTARVKARLAYLKKERAALAGLDYHEIVYEDDLEDPSAHQRTVAGIFDYLGLEGSYQVSTRLRKINTASMGELISDYDGFVECMRAEGWEGYLD